MGVFHRQKSLAQMQSEVAELRAELRVLRGRQSARSTRKAFKKQRGALRRSGAAGRKRQFASLVAYAFKKGGARTFKEAVKQAKKQYHS